METGLVMYAASRPFPAIHARRPARRVAAAAGALLNGCDADAVRTIWGLDLDLVSDAVAEHGLAEGGLIAHGAGLGVGLGGADDPIGLVAGAVLLEANGAAHADDA